MLAKELRQKYLEFFQSKGHAIIPSASLIPENDPTVLFTTAGMHPLTPYLLGEPHPLGKRLVDSQKCLRTVDIDDIGDNRHLTFFEMLGNWSLGDYFKKEAIEWSWEFLFNPKWLGLDPHRLYISVFQGDSNAPIDEESIKLWQESFKQAGLEAQVCPGNQEIAGNKNLRIFPLPAKDNWWGPAGETGPCGPCTEMFYDVNPNAGILQKSFDKEVEQGRIMEIWNDVFMEYNKIGPNKFAKLVQKNVDTGMGLERTIVIINGKEDVFASELFSSVFRKLESLSGKKYSDSAETKKAMRLIADHLRAATFIMGDEKGITPSNTDQGYIVRRLIRRAIRYGKQIGISEESWTKEIAKIVAHDYAEVFPELQKNIDRIIYELKKEETKFGRTLGQGLKELNKLYPVGRTKIIDKQKIRAKDAFYIYQSYGFPLELIQEELAKQGLVVDEAEFNNEFKKHQELSRTASVGKFKGGLADASEATRKLHTVAHLLLAALRQVLGEQVVQKGSNITAERLRFDFSHGDKLTEEQKQAVERLVNKAIQDNLPVNCQEMDLTEAKKAGAMGVFDSKYDSKVKVYTIGQGNKIFSQEICGGPHVKQTGELGKFAIIKEESSSAGVRRIKAILK